MIVIKYALNSSFDMRRIGDVCVCVQEGLQSIHVRFNSTTVSITGKID